MLPTVEERPLTREEIQAEVIQAAIEDRQPFDWRDQRKGTARPRPTGPVAEDVFTASDLMMDNLPEGVEYTVPRRGKRLWIFPCSNADRRDLLRWSVQRHPLASDPDGELVRQMEMSETTKVFGVIIVCRTGPTRDFKRCFGKEDFHAVLNYLGADVVDSIVRISDGLGGADPQFDSGVRLFFGLARRISETCSSRWSDSDGSQPGWQATLEEYASLVSRASMRGNLDSAMIAEGQALLARLDSAEG